MEMATKPRKTSIVSKKVSDEQLQNAIRWEKFLIASGTPFLSLSDEWLAFFDGQANIETAQTELVRLIDAAILKDEKK
jgi:hypothetical protein